MSERSDTGVRCSLLIDINTPQSQQLCIANELTTDVDIYYGLRL